MVSFNNKPVKDILVEDNDVSPSFLKLVHDSRLVAWDIETSGLEWNIHQIGTCQLFVPQGVVAVVKIGTSVPKKMLDILSNGDIKKVFHYAVFDLRFMCYRWGVSVRNIACTKIAAKLLYPANAEYHSLKSLLKQYLNIEIDKSQRQSNWLSKDLSNEQIEYAAKDVIYLFDLLEALEKDLDSKGLLGLAYRCYSHIPTRVDLDIIHRYTDIYGY